MPNDTKEYLKLIRYENDIELVIIDEKTHIAQSILKINQKGILLYRLATLDVMQDISGFIKVLYDGDED